LALKRLLPKRKRTSNKADGGKVLIIGGGNGLQGAGILSALAATKSGAGYTHLMTDLANFPWLKFPDFIVHPIKLNELKNKKDFSIGIGPGLGKEKSKINLIKFLIKHHFFNVIADADALTIIAENKIFPLPESWILTPHEVELGRLLGMSLAKIRLDRKSALITAQSKYRCTILLKGHETLILSPESLKVTSTHYGSIALSKAGTGDVLLGIITAFRAQGLSPNEAALLGVYVHGKSAQKFLSEGNDHLSLRPMDLLEKIPSILLELRYS
jgi:ADP-dependent NAD(P)H-hydrate dehydratase